MKVESSMLSFLSWFKQDLGYPEQTICFGLIFIYFYDGMVHKATACDYTVVRGLSKDREDPGLSVPEIPRIENICSEAASENTHLPGLEALPC